MTEIFYFVMKWFVQPVGGNSILVIAKVLKQADFTGQQVAIKHQ